MLVEYLGGDPFTLADTPEHQWDRRFCRHADLHQLPVLIVRSNHPLQALDPFFRGPAPFLPSKYLHAILELSLASVHRDIHFYIVFRIDRRYIDGDDHG